MHDIIWFFAISALFVFLGFLFIRLGLAIWKKQKMELIIRHHCDRVSKENKPAFCTLSGIGLFAIGTGFILSGICSVFMRSFFSFIPMAFGLTSGIVLLILAEIRYNH